MYSLVFSLSIELPFMVIIYSPVAVPAVFTNGLLISTLVSDVKSKFKTGVTTLPTLPEVYGAIYNVLLLIVSPSAVTVQVFAVFALFALIEKFCFSGVALAFAPTTLIT